MSDRDAYQDKLQAQLDEWKADIDKLRARAAQAEADARIALEREVDELNARREAVAAKLAELRSASGEAFDDLKQGADAARQQLGSAISAAVQRFSR